MTNKWVAIGVCAGFFAGMAFEYSAMGLSGLKSEIKNESFAFDLSDELSGVRTTSLTGDKIELYRPSEDHTQLRYYEQRIEASELGTDELIEVYNAKMDQLILVQKRLTEATPPELVKPMADAAYAFWYEINSRGIPIPKESLNFDEVWIDMNLR